MKKEKKKNTRHFYCVLLSFFSFSFAILPVCQLPATGCQAVCLRQAGLARTGVC